MSNYVVDNAYYEWLLNKIDYNDGYDTELETLFHVTFTWNVANDDNRAKDGIILRSVFMSEEDWSTEPCENYDCSVLEMMIALAMRIENDIMWDGETDKTSKWFWIMFRNLGLDETMSSAEVYDILDRFLLRKYAYDGTGGLFPLGKNATEDQRNVEIWYQAQSYLMENFSCF